MPASIGKSAGTASLLAQYATALQAILDQPCHHPFRPFHDPRQDPSPVDPYLYLGSHPELTPRYAQGVAELRQSAAQASQSSVTCAHSQSAPPLQHLATTANPTGPLLPSKHGSLQHRCAAAYDQSGACQRCCAQTLGMSDQQQGKHAQQAGKHGAWSAGRKLANAASAFSRPHYASDSTVGQAPRLDSHTCCTKCR